MRVLILGVNGFIGNALTRRILGTTDWEVWGLDVGSDRITEFLDDKRFRERRNLTPERYRVGVRDGA